jgi:hypothetical protein
MEFNRECDLYLRPHGYDTKKNNDDFFQITEKEEQSAEVLTSGS